MNLLNDMNRHLFYSNIKVCKIYLQKLTFIPLRIKKGDNSGTAIHGRSQDLNI